METRKTVYVILEYYLDQDVEVAGVYSDVDVAENRLEELKDQIVEGTRKSNCVRIFYRNLQ